MDIKTRSIIYLDESGTLEVGYINSDENPAASNNCKEKTHMRHADVIYEGMLDLLNREAVTEVSKP